MKKLLIIVIRFYQRTFSPDQGFFVRAGLRRSGNHCVFYPSCSEYAVLAITKYGAVRGVGRAAKRVFRCHPWQTPKVDMP